MGTGMAIPECTNLYTDVDFCALDGNRYLRFLKNGGGALLEVTEMGAYHLPVVWCFTRSTGWSGY